jgi:hypothetical protein
MNRLECEHDNFREAVHWMVETDADEEIRLR